MASSSGQRCRESGKYHFMQKKWGPVPPGFDAPAVIRGRPLQPILTLALHATLLALSPFNLPWVFEGHVKCPFYSFCSGVLLISKILRKFLVGSWLFLREAGATVEHRHRKRIRTGDTHANSDVIMTLEF